MQTTEQEDSKSGKQSLITDNEEDENSTTAVWLTLTTKKHIADTKRLKPAKISVPHPLNTSPTTTICLITADPQRTYKDIIASPAFPSTLSARITRVIGVTKIKKKYTQYEAQRQLLSEHDIFLADDRIITQLPKLLGKTFYKSSAKRPIPVSIQAPPPRSEGKKIARAKGEGAAPAASPKVIAAEIEKAIQGVLVHLSPSTNTSVRVGYSGWEAEKIAENVEVVANVLIEKFVPKKWRGVRALHIKGPATAALPIWLADELWTDEGDVLDEETLREKAVPNAGKKRKAIEGPAEDKKESVKNTKLVESSDDNLDKEIALRKEKLKQQKEEAAKVVGDDVPKASRKSKKLKVVAA